VNFQHGIARPRVPNKLKKLWKYLTGTPYSLDNFFRSIHSALSGERFSFHEKVTKCVDEWIDAKKPDLFYCGIHLLLEK